MIGTQALLAFRTSDGSIDVDAYNISSYKVRKSKIAYEVSDLGAEYGSDGVITIFATMKLPAGTTKVNQVWQVGPSVADGIPVKHSFDPASLASRTTLDLVAGGISSGGTSSRLRKANVRILPLQRPLAICIIPVLELNFWLVKFYLAYSRWLPCRRSWTRFGISPWKFSD